MAGAHSSAWWSVLRSALLFAPVLAVSLFVVAFLASEVAEDGASAAPILALVLVGSFAILLTYQVVQSIRDLFSSAVETVGKVERCWSRNDFFLFRNSYIFVDRDVFRVPAEQGATLQPGDRVRVVHYPHTGAVEELEVLTSGGTTETSSDRG